MLKVIAICVHNTCNDHRANLTVHACYNLRNTNIKSVNACVALNASVNFDVMSNIWLDGCLKTFKVQVNYIILHFVNSLNTNSLSLHSAAIAGYDIAKKYVLWEFVCRYKLQHIIAVYLWHTVKQLLKDTHTIHLISLQRTSSAVPTGLWQ